MAHCKACNEMLTLQEETRKGLYSKEELLLCNTCLAYIKDDIKWEDNENFIRQENEIDPMMSEEWERMFDPYEEE